MIIKKVIFALISTIALNVNADISTVTREKELAEENIYLKKLLEQSKGITNLSSIISEACLKPPLPIVPRTPNFSKTYADKYTGKDEIKLTFWREPCKDGSGVVLLVRAKPLDGHPYLSFNSVAIIQNNAQINDIVLQDSTKDNLGWFYDDLYIEQTFVVYQYSEDETQFDPAKALTLYYEDEPLDIPAAQNTSNKSLNGATVGLKEYKYNCKNLRTKQSIYKKSQPRTDWNCSKLRLRKGDTVQVFIKGIVE